MEQAMQVLTSHKSQEWYTPPDYVALVRAVLGEIDLDPASNEFPQTWIQANRFWRRGGLSRNWNARTVFCNPPYGKSKGISNQALWSAYMAEQYKLRHFEKGILLINSTPGYVWYEDLWVKYPVCLLRERLRFVKPDGTSAGQAKRSQTLVYFGQDASKFIWTFRDLGRIMMPAIRG